MKSKPCQVSQCLGRLGLQEAMDGLWPKKAAGSRHHIKWELAPNKMKRPTFSLKNANKNDEADLISFYWNSTKGDNYIENDIT